jgi:hypothetical protein
MFPVSRLATSGTGNDTTRAPPLISWFACNDPAFARRTAGPDSGTVSATVFLSTVTGRDATKATGSIASAISGSTSALVPICSKGSTGVGACK